MARQACISILLTPLKEFYFVKLQELCQLDILRLVKQLSDILFLYVYRLDSFHKKMTENRTVAKKSGSALVSPDRQMFFCKKSRSLTFIAEGYLTRGARRWSWTILEVEFYTFLVM
jgi:hypothetical protein